MPSTENFTGRSIPPEKLTRTPAPSSKVQRLVSRVTEVKEQVAGIADAGNNCISSNPQLLRTKQNASKAAHSTINIISYELQSNMDFVAGAFNNVPFNVARIGGKGAEAGSYTAATNFKFRPPCERLGFYQVYYYLGLEFPAAPPYIEQLIPMLYRNGLFYRAGDWSTAANNSTDGLHILNSALHMTTVVELSELTDYIEPLVYYTGSGNQTVLYSPNPLVNSVYGYIDITYIGCSEHVADLGIQPDSHPRV